MTRFDATKGYKVTYPVTDEQLKKLLEGGTMEEGFKWFAANKGGRLQARAKTSLKENMKYPMSANNIALTALHVEEKPKNGGNYNGGNRNNGGGRGGYNQGNRYGGKKFK